MSGFHAKTFSLFYRLAPYLNLPFPPQALPPFQVGAEYVRLPFFISLVLGFGLKPEIAESNYDSQGQGLGR